MIRVLVVWEDLYFEPIGQIVRRRLSLRASGESTPVAGIMFHTAKGNSNFDRYVASTWPKVRSTGLPGNKGRIDHLICVADGDRLHEILTGQSGPPSAPADVPAWHAKIEAAWHDQLRAASKEAAPDAVHGRVLRWSKESIVLAGYDKGPAKDHLRIDARGAQAQAFLDRCSPVPTTVDPGVFTDTYRRPLWCLNELRKAQGLDSMTKNAPEIDDALRSLAVNEALAVCERVPDLERVVDLVCDLAQ